MHIWHKWYRSWTRLTYPNWFYFRRTTFRFAPLSICLWIIPNICSWVPLVLLHNEFTTIWLYFFTRMNRLHYRGGIYVTIAWMQSWYGITIFNAILPRTRFSICKLFDCITLLIWIYLPSRGSRRSAWFQIIAFETSTQNCCRDASLSVFNIEIRSDDKICIHHSCNHHLLFNLFFIYTELLRAISCYATIR